MKTLILCVDRDDDVGRKAHLDTPIFGREDNIEAAIKLGLMDAEDTDTNSILAGVSIYDSCVESGEEAYVATIAGHPHVGTVSDRIIAQQLDEVLAQSGADNVVLVTDGAEDEYVLPIISSRVKVSSVRSIVMKQSKSLEDTFYMIKKFFEDEKLQLQIVVPIALVMVIYAILAMTGFKYSLSWIVLLIGAYLLAKPAIRTLKQFYGVIKVNLLSSITIISGIIIAISTSIHYYNKFYTIHPSPARYWQITSFIDNEVWWMIGAILLIGIGITIDNYIKHKDVRLLYSYLSLPVIFVAIGIITTSLTEFIRISIGSKSYRAMFESIAFIRFLIGIGIVMIGVFLHYYLKRRYYTE